MQESLQLISSQVQGLQPQILVTISNTSYNLKYQLRPQNKLQPQIQVTSQIQITSQI